MDEGKFTVFSRRLGIMVVALITPDRLLQSGRTILSDAISDIIDCLASLWELFLTCTIQFFAYDK
jgi:hypothetical protein